MTILTEINYTQTELIEYANEHNMYKKGTKQKKLITQNLTPNTKQEARTNVTNSGAYNHAGVGREFRSHSTGQDYRSHVHIEYWAEKCFVDLKPTIVNWDFWTCRNFFYQKYKDLCFVLDAVKFSLNFIQILKVLIMLSLNPMVSMHVNRWNVFFFGKICFQPTLICFNL